MLPEFSQPNPRMQMALPTFPAPKTVILCDQTPFVKNLLLKTPHQQCDGCFPRLYLLKDHPGIGIANFGSETLTLAAKMEELIAWGVLQFIAIGTAGSLQTKIKSGDIFICEKAIRDEETSHRYLPPAKYIHAPRRMTNKLQQQLKKSGLCFHIGSTWTTEKLYQPTSEEVVQYQKEGVMTVEKEAAALFAIAHFYQVDLGALFTISDSQADLFWQPHPEDERSFQGLEALFATALEASKDTLEPNKTP
jgi:purine-nucleoside phosphorylase